MVVRELRAGRSLRYTEDVEVRGWLTGSRGRSRAPTCLVGSPRETWIPAPALGTEFGVCASKHAECGKDVRGSGSSVSADTGVTAKWAGCERCSTTRWCLRDGSRVEMPSTGPTGVPP